MERTPYTERHANAPRAEHPRAGGLGLALGYSGLLYQEGVRAMVGTALQPWTLVGYEASFAMHQALSAVRKYFDGRRAERLRRSARSLWELRENRDGLTLPELCEPRLRDEDEVLRAVEELEHKGELVRRRGEDGPDVFALTERGQLVFDGHLRHKAEAERPLLEDIPPEQLALMRHVCVQAVANRDWCEVGPLGPSPTNVADTSRWQTAREGDGGHLYVTQVRESIGPLEPEVVLRLETLLVLGGSAGSLPRALPTRPGAVCLWALRGEPEGIRRSRFVEALGEEASEALGKLEASGLVTRAAPAEAGDDDAAAVVHRLTAEGREALEDRVRKLEEEVAAAFEGVSMEDLALARDGCWRIVLNCLTAAAR